MPRLYIISYDLILMLLIFSLLVCIDAEFGPKLSVSTMLKLQSALINADMFCQIINRSAR